MRILRLSQIVTRSSIKQHFSKIVSEDLILRHSGVQSSIIPLSFYSSKGKDDKVCETDTKKEEPSIKKSHHHPENVDKSKEDSSKIKLKECKPINLDPCKPFPNRPSFSMKIPTIQDCPTHNLMNECPQPEGSWDEENKNTRSKYKNILLLGLLFTAATVASAWYIGVFNPVKVEKKVTEKKLVKKTKRSVIKVPASSKDIPNEVPYLLVGGGTASFAAFRAIKSSDPTAKVLVVTNESFYPYMRPPLSKEIWFNEDKESVRKLIFKQWNGSERSLFYEPDDFYSDCNQLMDNPNGGVAVARGWAVKRIDAGEKIAYLEDETPIKYNKCLLATGATPKLSPAFEVAMNDEKIAERVKIFRNIYDFEETLEAFEESKNMAIIGGGFLGSELACAMARKDKKKSKQFHQIFREVGNMGKILPEYLSLWTTDKVKAEGVHVMPQTEVVGVKSDGKGLELTLNTGKKLYVDNVVVAVGVEPNTELAEKSDLEVDPELGGFLVNTELQARTDLYIAGDCACFYDVRLGRRRIEHHDHAVVTGRVAGENMAGARKPYLHQSMFWSDLGPDVGYEAIGIVDASLPTVAVFAKATDKDNPKAVVTATDEGIRSNTEKIPEECEKYVSEEKKAEITEARKQQSLPNKVLGEDYGKGVIFYLRNDIVVGIVLWNVFNRMSIARQVLKDQRKYDDLNEVAKLFNIHED